MVNWKQWNKILGLLLITFIFLYITISESILYRINENLDIEHSISKQIKESALYGRAIIGQDYLYKLEMAKNNKADVLILGSSRVMQFRKAFFKESVSFYNAGGAIPATSDGYEFVSEVTKFYKPKIVILGVDLWWLNPNYKYNIPVNNDLLEGSEAVKRKYLYGALLDFIKRKEVIRDYKEIFGVNWQNAHDPVGNKPTIGLSAAMKGNGFRVDGSYQYGEVIMKNEESDPEFSDTLERIRTGRRRFEAAEDVSKLKLQELQNIIRKLKDNDTLVVVFLPPFAHKVYEAMENSSSHSNYLHNFRYAVKELCEQETIVFHDYSDIEWVDSNDLETIDGFHGSEVCYARITLDLAQNNAIINNIVAVDDLKSKIAASRNPKILGN